MAQGMTETSDLVTDRMYVDLYSDNPISVALSRAWEYWEFHCQADFETFELWLKTTYNISWRYMPRTHVLNNIHRDDLFRFVLEWG